MCFICGRGSCCPSFHSLEEQEAYEPAEEAYDKYLEIRAQCEAAYNQSEEDDEEEEEDMPGLEGTKDALNKLGT